MNIAVIFAGGTGQRMNPTALPKQFLKVHGKPIIVHTIEKFQNCDQVDKIVVVSLSEYIDYLFELKKEYRLTKIESVVGGGTTGQDSIFNGLIAAKGISKSENDIVLIHDGVRPLIDEKTIKDNIVCVKEKGSAITVAKATETILISNKSDSDAVGEVLNRDNCYLGRAPQSFFLTAILEAHKKSRELGVDSFTDSASMMRFFGNELYAVEGPTDNIKITTPMDFFVFKALLDAEENKQIGVL